MLCFQLEQEKETSVQMNENAPRMAKALWNIPYYISISEQKISPNTSMNKPSIYVITINWYRILFSRTSFQYIAIQTISYM